jgi:hypothetical protein
MTVKEIWSDETPPPCGNCGAELPPSRVLRVYLFDKLHEVSEKVRTGKACVRAADTRVGFGPDS